VITQVIKAAIDTVHSHRRNTPDLPQHQRYPHDRGGSSPKRAILLDATAAPVTGDLHHRPEDASMPHRADDVIPQMFVRA